jgi:hypothetical protein
LNYTTTFYELPSVSDAFESQSFSLKEEEDTLDGETLFKQFSQKFKHKKASLTSEETNISVVNKEKQQLINKPIENVVSEDLIRSSIQEKKPSPSEVVLEEPTSKKTLEPSKF